MSLEVFVSRVQSCAWAFLFLKFLFLMPGPFDLEMHLLPILVS
jgi:hypothetical protein